MRTDRQNVKKRVSNRWTYEDLIRLQNAGKITIVTPKSTIQNTLPFAEKENRKQAAKRKGPAEFHLQIRCVRWLDFFYPHLKNLKKRFHVANQGWKGGEKTGALLKAMGKTAGVVDFFILVKTELYSGLLIDFKVEGEGLSPAQEVFFSSMRQEGFKCEAVNNYETFINLITDYLGPAPKNKFLT